MSILQIHRFHYYIQLANRINLLPKLKNLNVFFMTFHAISTFISCHSWHSMSSPHLYHVIHCIPCNLHIYIMSFMTFHLLHAIYESCHFSHSTKFTCMNQNFHINIMSFMTFHVIFMIMLFMTCYTINTSSTKSDNHRSVTGVVLSAIN